MTSDNMTSGGRLSRILDRASEDPQFRNKVILLGAMADDTTYSALDDFMIFRPKMLEVAGEAGLLADLTQDRLNELMEWFDDSANEIAFFACRRTRIPASPRYRSRVGHAFVSWTVKNPRDREAFTGIREALDWFNIEYFDYTEHQLDDEVDRGDAIVQQLEEAVAKSQVSIEVVSTEVGRPWVQYERSLISRDHTMHRFLVCLEWEKAQLVRMDDEQESRSTRIDMSGGRMGMGMTTQMDQWMDQASDTRYYSTTQFILQCYKIASQIRDLLARSRNHTSESIMLDNVHFGTGRDRRRFVSLAHHRRMCNEQAMNIRKGVNCKTAQLDDLLFHVPLEWRERKQSTGHWFFTPVGTDRDVTIQVMFFNADKDGMLLSDQLITEMEDKAQESDGLLTTTKTKRHITREIIGVDIIAEEINGITHRFVNFPYNGLEYFVEIKADTSGDLARTNNVWDAWLDGFHFRQQPTEQKAD